MLSRYMKLNQYITKKPFVRQFSSEFPKKPNAISAFIILVTVATGTAATYVALTASNYSEAKKSKLEYLHTVSVAIQNNKVHMSSSSSATYIDRKGLEEAVHLILQKKDFGYTVVYGPKGTGKTEVVEHCAEGLSGVVKLIVTSANTKDDLVSDILEQLADIEESNLKVQQLLRAVQRCEYKPTIIFDVEMGHSEETVVNSDTIQSVRSLAKLLSKSCAVVIILPDTNAITEFGKDTDREEYLFVGELTHEDGKKFLQKLGTHFTERELDFVFTNIGTRAALLENLVNKVPSQLTLEQFVKDELDEAEVQLMTFPHQAILQELKKHPDGVSVMQFEGIFHDGVHLADTKAVVKSMKNSSTIVYRIDLKEYQLKSTALRTVLLKTFKPLVLDKV